jgi:hypothetical protein
MEPTPLLARKGEKVLDCMRDKRVSLTDLLSYVLDTQSPRCASYRRWLFDGLESTLARVDERRRGRGTLRKWSLRLTSRVINREMQKIRMALTMKTVELTPDFAETWSFSGLHNVVKHEAPTLSELLCTGIQAKRTRSKGKKDPMVVCTRCHSSCSS